ncbi:MAG: lipase family protein [Bacteroidetes bacterium]|nr:lipase family protein [Bacteroidota bacterium]
MKNLNISIKQVLFIIIILIIGFYSCKKEENETPPPPITHERGEIVQITDLGTMSPTDIQQILDNAGFDIPFSLSYSVKSISVSYYSVDADNKQIIVSGAMMLPTGTNNLPLMSLHHGTETKRELVASVSPLNSTEGIIGLITGSMGYFTVVPDYPGFGISTIMHPYIHAASILPSVIDFMRAGKSYCLQNQIILNDQVFLTGYSEGGYISLVAQNLIEADYSDEFNLKAVAPMAGPYDLKGTVDSIFNADNYSTPAYAAYFLTAYNKIYGWNRLNDMFSAPYASKMPGLFDGSKTWGDIVNQVPSTMADLMNPQFIEDYKNGLETELIEALEDNTRLNWTPQTPLHFFHGDTDEIVPYQNAIAAKEAFNAHGATNIQITTIPGGTHETAGPAAVIAVLQWFDSLK